MELSKGTVLPVLKPGQNLVVISSGGVWMRINYVSIRSPDVISYEKDGTCTAVIASTMSISFVGGHSILHETLKGWLENNLSYVPVIFEVKELYHKCEMNGLIGTKENGLRFRLISVLAFFKSKNFEYPGTTKLVELLESSGGSLLKDIDSPLHVLDCLLRTPHFSLLNIEDASTEELKSAISALPYAVILMSIATPRRAEDGSSRMRCE
ncbi:hypothetical protein GIB67_028521 [Kingdonia uniflora]|uniref:Uncharacterized protein n=1 Tax=Kingdonia uniflora TaxID=39325 RepID=A0A7J7KVW2_9MAGN|nr:hypothetical protein GIB67_028521 [Kingdonia uniflora]